MLFELKNIKYKEVLDIQEIKIPEETITCIIGASGSGKSTLLKLLNNMISPDKGEIFYHDIPLSKIDPVQLRRQIIMLPQTPVIFPGNIRENLIIGLKFAQKNIPADEVLNKMLLLVDLGKSLADETNHLSGGEQQKLSLARALLMEPEVLLLDEPSAALDQESEDKLIKNLVLARKEKRKNLIIVTHAVNIAHQYGEKIFLLKPGKVVEQEVAPNGKHL